MPKGIYIRTEYHNTISRKNGFKKGQNLGNTNGFKKGQTPWNKNKPFPQMIGNTNGFRNGNMPWNKDKKGLQVAWNKDKKGVMPIPWNKDKKGVMPIPWNKDTKGIMPSGEKNGNYKGGVCNINAETRQRIMASPEYKQWRLEVFKRDDYRCFDCGERGGDLQADHIYQWSEYPNLRFEILNGQTLCKPCHKIKTKFERTGKMVLNSPITV